MFIGYFWGKKKKRIFNSIFFATPLFAMHCYSLYIKPIANEFHHSWFMNPTQYVNTTNSVNGSMKSDATIDFDIPHLTHGHASMPFFCGQRYWYCPLELKLHWPNAKVYGQIRRREIENDKNWGSFSVPYRLMNEITEYPWLLYATFAKDKKSNWKICEWFW